MTPYLLPRVDHPDASNPRNQEVQQPVVQTDKQTNKNRNHPPDVDDINFSTKRQCNPCVLSVSPSSRVRVTRSAIACPRFVSVCAKAPTTVLAPTPRFADGNFQPFVNFVRGIECPFVCTSARQRAFLCTATYPGSVQTTTRRDSTQGSRETHIHKEMWTDQQKDLDRDTIRELKKKKTRWDTSDRLCGRCTL